MLLNDYQIHTIQKPADNLELYCKIEGLDPMYARSTIRREKNRAKLYKGSVLKIKVKRWLEIFKNNRLPISLNKEEREVC